MLSLRRALALAAGVAAAAALPAAAAQADSIVYLKDHQVWIAHADGSGARQFTRYAYGWKSPSEADDGTVVVLGGVARVNPGGTDSSGSSEIYRFHGDGNQIGGPIPTWGSYSSPSCPSYGPESARVSPDGAKIAYGIWRCGGMDYTTLWTPATATGLDFPAPQDQGQVDYYQPQWLDSTRYTVSHAGPTVTSTQAEWFVHKTDTSDYDSSQGGWYEPAMTGTGIQAVISHTGRTLAVFEDDAADWTDGVPRHEKLWIYTSPTTGLPSTQSWDERCQIPLDPAHMRDPYDLSPSFSPDDLTLAWGNDDGVQTASVANPANCGTIVPGTLIPGGSQPYFGGGDLVAGAANANQPGAPATTTAGNGTPTGGTPGPGGSGGQVISTKPKPKAAFKVKPKHPRARRKITFDGSASSEPGGAIKAWIWSFGDKKKGSGRKVTHRYKKAKTYAVKLTVRDKSGATSVAKKQVKVKR